MIKKIKFILKSYLIPPGITQAYQKWNDNRLRKQYSSTSNDYDAEKYWNERLTIYGTSSLLGVGHIGQSEFENQASYKGAEIIFKALINDLKLKKSANICEFGFGNGFYTAIMAKLGFSNYIGCDITDALIPDIKRHLKDSSIELKKFDVTQNKLTSNNQDFIFMIDVTQHIVNKEKLVFCLQNNVVNLLKENGYFLVTDLLSNEKISFKEVTRSLKFYTDTLKGLSIFHEPIWFRDKYIFSFKKTT